MKNLFGKRSVLHHLITALTVPTILVLVLAWVVYQQFEITMKQNAEHYVENLVDSIASRFLSPKLYMRPDGVIVRVPDVNAIAKIAEVLSEFDMPGTFGIYKSNGKLLYAASDPELLARLTGLLKKAGVPEHIHMLGDGYYTAMAFPLEPKGIYIVGAISWKMLFGAMTILVTIWPFIIGGLALVIILAIYFLCIDVIAPLREFNAEALSLKLGFDLPAEKKGGRVPELTQLRHTFALLAQSAIDKEKLTRDYVTDIVRVQEEERERISREIHDGPLQDATALVQRLRLLALDTQNEAVIKKLHNADMIAMAEVKELREICNNLTPPWLDLGIYRAIAELCSHNPHNDNVNIELDSDFSDMDEDDVTPAACLACYRVTQEAISNSVMHGHARNISIKLTKSETRLQLAIKDDGEGFAVPENIKELRVQGHRGLSNMIERMGLVDGTISIKSEIGSGTSVTCEVPLKNNRNGEL